MQLAIISMLRVTGVAFGLMISSSAIASEYCYDRYETKIRSASGELADRLQRLNVLQTTLRETFERKDLASKEMANIVRTDPELKNPSNRARMVELSAQYDQLDKTEASAKNESFQIQDRVTALKSVVPADLQGELRGCVEAVKPANQAVNTVIQVLAILSTGGASLALPPKSLYVDMGQVLNGYPFGGNAALIPKARDDVLNALGIGGTNNEIGKVIRDPGRVVRCWFGC
jgi:hypothetical protein